MEWECRGGSVELLNLKSIAIEESFYPFFIASWPSSAMLSTHNLEVLLTSILTHHRAPFSWGTNSRVINFIWKLTLALRLNYYTNEVGLKFISVQLPINEWLVLAGLARSCPQNAP